MSRAAHQRCVVVMSASAAIHRQCPEPRCVSVSIQLPFEQHARQRPPDSFEKQANGSFTFAGSVIGVTMQATIKPTRTLRYSFSATAQPPIWPGRLIPFSVADHRKRQRNDVVQCRRYEGSNEVVGPTPSVRGRGAVRGRGGPRCRPFAIVTSHSDPRQTGSTAGRQTQSPSFD
jgi:hypothetical protein